MTDCVLLDAVLRPAPPLPPRVLRCDPEHRRRMNFAFALYFVAQGAWPIMPFMGVDVALLAWAFRAVTREAKREEHIVLTPSLLRIERAAAERAGARDRDAIPIGCAWRWTSRRNTASQLTLWSHGKGVRIGAFLPPQERASFAEQLKAALWKAKTTLPLGRVDNLLSKAKQISGGVRPQTPDPSPKTLRVFDPPSRGGSDLAQESGRGHGSAAPYSLYESFP